MPFLTTFILLSATGLVNAGYLTYQHYFEKKPLVCPIGHDCNAVVESKWGNFLGVRNEVLGVLFYAGMLIGILISIAAPGLIPNINFLLFAGAGIGLLFSIILVLIQKFAIKDYCFYCLISAGISLLLFVNSLAIL